MDLLTFIFAFSSSAALTMVVIQRRRLEHGKIEPSTSGSKASFFWKLIKWRKKVGKFVRFLFLIFLTRILYVSAYIFDRLRKMTHKRIQKMEAAMINRGALSRRQGAASLFLKDVAVYKKRALNRMRRKSVREKELSSLEE